MREWIKYIYIDALWDICARISPLQFLLPCMLEAGGVCNPNSVSHPSSSHSIGEEDAKHKVTMIQDTMGGREACVGEIICCHKCRSSKPTLKRLTRQKMIPLDPTNE